MEKLHLFMFLFEISTIATAHIPVQFCLFSISASAVENFVFSVLGNPCPRNLPSLSISVLF